VRAPPASSAASASDRTAWIVICVLTVVVLGLVVALHWVPKPSVMPAWGAWLPKLNAALNSLCTLLLAASWLAVRRGNSLLHKRLNVTAFVLSTVFLLSYVVFHAVAPQTRYPADLPLRSLYRAILGSHILLAMVVLPAVLLTFWLALKGRWAGHRRLARWTMPAWLYVTTTGVIVYFMIAPHYPF
jgi:putative membrane protein